VIAAETLGVSLGRYLTAAGQLQAAKLAASMLDT